MLNFDSQYFSITVHNECHQKSKLDSVFQKTHEFILKNNLGFFDWPENITSNEIRAIQEKAQAIREKYDGALVLGIGGSHLGAHALLQSLAAINDSFATHFLFNIDSYAIEEAEHFIRARKNIIPIMISKSGGTLETLTSYLYLFKELDNKETVVVTDPHSGFLHELAKIKSWSQFDVPPSIGGRFSALTAVGLLPAALSGIAMDELILGAKTMRHELLKDQNSNVALQWANQMFLADIDNGKNIQYQFAYHKRLEVFSNWFVQLWAESLGQKNRKTGQGVGPTPIAALGTRDQHSILQLLQEGPSNKVVGFISIEPSVEQRKILIPNSNFKNYAFLEGKSLDEIQLRASYATEQSLLEAGVTTYRLHLKKLDPQSMGAMMFYFMSACAYAATLYDVHGFNQPGVELSKKKWLASF